ncbi:MAG TPA: hypothetical protein VEL31_04185 [Ktedonobacteraceae bacterium]|nr:hypothetical protein [Ktedonobacteraceae bacterium]
MDQQQVSTYVAVLTCQVTESSSFRILPVAFRETPMKVCGQAQRIGYTCDELFPIYQLRIRGDTKLRRTLLKGHFVLLPGEEGFLDYEQWMKNHNKSVGLTLHTEQRGDDTAA